MFEGERAPRYSGPEEMADKARCPLDTAEIRELRINKFKLRMVATPDSNRHSR